MRVAKLITALFGCMGCLAQTNAQQDSAKCASAYEMVYHLNNINVDSTTWACYLINIAANADGSSICAGGTQQFGAGEEDGYLQKIDNKGNLLWGRAIGGKWNDEFKSVKPTPDGGYVAVGRTITGSADIAASGGLWLVKVDASGNVQWSKEYADGYQSGIVGTDVIVTSDGGYAICGMDQPQSEPNQIITGTRQILVIKTDILGNVRWAKAYYNYYKAEGFGILEDQDSLVVSTGGYEQGFTYYDGVIMKLSLATGDTYWARDYSMQGQGISFGRLYKTKTGYVVNGITNHFSAAIVATDRNGAPIAVNSVSHFFPHLAYPGGLCPTADGGLLLTEFDDAANGYSHLFKIDQNYHLQWATGIFGADRQQINSVLQQPDQGYLLGGNLLNPVVGIVPNVHYFPYIIKADSTGNVTGCGVSVKDSVDIEPLPYRYIPAYVWQSSADITNTLVTIDVNLSDTAGVFVQTPLCGACKVDSLLTVTPTFTITDTVCVNAPVTITNTTVGASSYYWSFCAANVNTSPTGTNLGALGGAFQTPVFMDIATQNGNYYGFVTNFATGTLTRLDFGNSLLNAPNYTNLGSFGGILPYGTTEGIQVVQNGGNWYAIIVGGTPNAKIVKISFGSSLSNPSPTATDWGNIGNLALPHDLSVFQEGNNWYGITINKNNNSVTRFDFTSSFENTPTGVNLGNLGNINTPTGMFAIKDSTWHVFIVNSYDGDNPTDYGTVTRLDFGKSLAGTPTAVNLGNLNNSLHNPRDISIIKFCGQAVGFVVNHLTNDIVKLDFNDNLESVPTAVSLGNTAGFNLPPSISKLFRSGTDLYALIPNASDNTLSRIQFAGCTNASVPNSTLQNPGVVTYQTPGIYNISLSIDDGLPTQNSQCRQVVVLGTPNIKVGNDTSICKGDSALLTASGAASYQWVPTTGLSTPLDSVTMAYTSSTTEYYVTAKNNFGCVGEDSVKVTVLPYPVVTTINDTAICHGTSLQLTTTSVNGVAYKWSPGQTLSDSAIASPVATPITTTQYYLQVKSAAGCTAKDSVKITVLQQPTINTIADTAVCSGATVQLVTTATNSIAYSWSPSKGLSNPNTLSPLATPSVTTKYVITVNPGTQCSAKDSVMVTVNPTPIVKAQSDTAICAGASVQLVATATVAGSYDWTPMAGLSDTGVYNPIANPTTTTQYFVTVTTTAKCSAKDSVTVTVLAQPTVNTIADTAFCSGTNIQLASTATNGNNYSWSPVTGLSNPNSSSPMATPTATTKYVITVNPGAQCTAKDSVTVTVKPLPVVEITNDTVICAGGSAQLFALSAGGAAYSWSPAAGLSGTTVPNPVATPTSTTKFYVMVTGNNQCKANDSMLVTVAPQPVFAINPSSATVCIGQSLGVAASGGDSYQWYPTAGVADPAAASTTITPQATTTYYVYITNSACKITDTVKTVITVTTKPVVTIGKSNDLDCFVSQAQLSATGGNQYVWSPPTGLNNPSTQNPVASPLQTTTYYVQVSKGASCMAQDSITVYVLTNTQNGYLLPSAFTPNGDGANDCFGVSLWGTIKTIDFSVYNRWGARIFHTNNPTDCWDGTYNGQKQDPGAYVYQIQANTICGPVYRKGTVVLVR